MMKMKLRILAFALLAAAAVQPAKSQGIPANSLNDHFSILGCDSTIVRCANDTIVLCCHYPSGGYSHRFVIRTSPNAQTRVLEIPVFATPNGTAFDQVHDMRILDTMCYFCGIRQEDSPLLPPVFRSRPDGSRAPISQGFMGYFSIPAVLRGQGVWHINTIDGLTTAARMAAYPLGGGRTGLSILGTTTDDSTCLAEMANSISAPHYWDCRIGRPSQEDEVLTDVTATKDKLVVASIFAEDNTLISFRETKIMEYGFCNPNSAGSSSSDRYEYSIRGIICPGQSAFPNGIWRYAGMPVLLCPDGEKFIAGFAGSQFWGNGNDKGLYNNYGHAILIHMETPSHMEGAQAIQYGLDAKLKEIVSVKDDKAAAVLTEGWYGWCPPMEDSVLTSLQFLRWDTVERCQAYYDTMLRIDRGMLHSIDKFDDHQAAASGCFWGSDKPFDAVQYQYRRSNASTCLTELHACEGMLRTRVLPPTEPEYTYDRWRATPQTGVEWTAMPFVSKERFSGTCSH